MSQSTKVARSMTLCVALIGGSAGPITAQARGAPVFFDPSYSYDTRIGVDIGAMKDAFSLVASGSRLFYVGNCKRIALSGAAGMLKPVDIDARLNTGASISMLLNPCPNPLSAPNPTIRLIAGGTLVRIHQRNVNDAYVGVSGGYLVRAPVARLEFWATPRAHYRDDLFRPDAAGWELAASVGFNFGIAGTAGLRFGVDCCDTGVGVGGGLSWWF